VALEYDRYCSEIVAQTELLRSEFVSRDLTTPVPSCPGWNVGQLVRHLGGGQRWAAAAVAAQVHEPLPEDDFAMRDLSAFVAEDPATLGPWLVEGAEELATALRAAGAGVTMWTPVPSTPTTDFYAARRRLRGRPRRRGRCHRRVVRARLAPSDVRIPPRDA
jgi:hypothetical protein